MDRGKRRSKHGVCTNACRVRNALDGGGREYTTSLGSHLVPSDSHMAGMGKTRCLFSPPIRLPRGRVALCGEAKSGIWGRGTLRCQLGRECGVHEVCFASRINDAVSRVRRAAVQDRTSGLGRARRFCTTGRRGLSAGVRAQVGPRGQTDRQGEAGRWLMRTHRRCVRAG